MEAFERIRRQIATEQEMLRKEHVANGGTGDPPKVPGYDPARPWNLVFQRAVQDDAFWREEVVEPGVMVLTKISGLNEQVTGDAPIKGEAVLDKYNHLRPHLEKQRSDLAKTAEEAGTTRSRMASTW